MTTVMLSRYTLDGKLWHAVLCNGIAAIAATEDEQWAAEYARALYHNTRGKARLLHYNGDTQVETVIEEA